MRTDADQRFTSHLVLVYLAGLVPGMVLYALTPHGEHVRFWALGIGLSAGLLYWVITRAGMRRWMPRHEHRDLMILILLPYHVWTGYAAVAYVNRGLDETKGVVRELRVLEHERRRKGSDKIVLSHWREGEVPFQVDGYGDVGTVLETRSHTGYLGLEWIEPPRHRRIEQK